MDNHPESLGEDSEKPSPETIAYHPDKERLSLAKSVLLGLTIIFVLSMVLFVCSPEQGRAIFEIASHGIPPIVTLILGYYFSKT